MKADRIVVAPSGDMAYEYGTAHMSFDSKKEGHVDFTAAYLRVWKTVDGKCKIAAEMFEPENQ
jgi:ketosteroid isomerase-like protein